MTKTSLQWVSSIMLQLLWTAEYLIQIKDLNNMHLQLVLPQSPDGDEHFLPTMEFWDI